MRTLVATADGCPHCGTPLVPGSRTGFCQDGWWQDQHRRHLAGEEVSALALPMLVAGRINADGRVIARAA